MSSLDELIQLSERPKLRWPRLATVVTAIGALAGVSVFVFPKLAELAFGHRLAILACLIVFPALCVAASFVWRWVAALWRRCRAYQALLNHVLELRAWLQRSQAFSQQLLEHEQGLVAGSIQYCFDFDGKVLIAIEKSEGLGISVGDKVVVVSAEGIVMGEFEVVEDRDDHYRCELAGLMEPVWHGLVKQAGAAHSEPPPGALAVILPVTEGEGNG